MFWNYFIKIAYQEKGFGYGLKLGEVKNEQRNARKTRKSIKTIRFPFGGVPFNVFGNTVHFVLIAHNVVVVTRLPRERDIVFAGETGDGRFNTANHCPQIFRLWPNCCRDALRASAKPRASVLVVCADAFKSDTFNVSLQTDAFNASVRRCPWIITIK